MCISLCIVKLLHYSVWISLVRWTHLQALSPSELCIHCIACCLQQIYDNLIAPMQIFFGFKHQALNVFTEGEKIIAKEWMQKGFIAHAVCCSS